MLQYFAHGLHFGLKINKKQIPRKLKNVCFRLKTLESPGDFHEYLFFCIDRSINPIPMNGNLSKEKIKMLFFQCRIFQDKSTSDPTDNPS